MDSQPRRDDTGAPVTVRLDEDGPVRAYAVVSENGDPLGRAEFLDSPAVDAERIFFHTEVAREFTGRGLARLLVRETLTDSIRSGVTVVPVCPLFATHLRRHGHEFVAAGGSFRQPTFADIALFKRMAEADGERTSHA